ncbi:MAG: peptidoglycan-binding protein [Eubacteriales bacterium]|nr:peptidoglycan-binding protein [Eubacteriales bacterium]
MKKSNVEVLRKILYAVESGGQVYGRQNYAAFVGAGANCSNEKAITIGAGQWYAGEAKKLLQKIQRADPAQFKRLDTQGVETDLLKKNWATYAISTTSAKAKCIVTIINSTLGRKCQDELMDEQITEYAASIAKTYGSMPDTAMMECVNIIHQGGSSALKRILAKTKPYTAKNIYDALNTDPADPRTNQVGDYVTRQKKVYEYITKYASDTTTGATTSEEDKKEESTVSTVQETINKAITWMEETARDDRHGYCQDHRWGEDGDYDCSSAVYTAWQSAGIPVKTYSLKKYGKAYTGVMLRAFTANGFTDVTAKVNRSTGAGLVRGDVLLNAARHTAMYCGNGMEVEASINEKGTAHGGTPGDQTGKEFLIRSYRNHPWTNILRYTGGNSATATEKNFLEMGDWGAAVKTMQTMLIECGYSCGEAGADGEFGTGTDIAVRRFQMKNGLTIDGQYGPASKTKLVALYNAKVGGNSSESKNPSKTPKWVGMVNTAELNVRTGAGAGNPKLAAYPLLKQRNLVDVCDTACAADGTDWYYIRIAGKYYGFVCGKYISEV